MTTQPQKKRINKFTMTESHTLPDPTADLHWSAYGGAIHEIFAENARKHPDRICVVETPSPTSPRRDFSYRQINEASNILAHHLVDNGVRRGEVVMVYAHRGVDLVVAIMGILKSGATFSVIDPLYPPDRQIIYLDVARPRALIIIEKASQEAGPLASSVRNFVAEHLQLRTEVPSLRISEDGFLAGGIAVKADCLHNQQNRRLEAPDILVGPDSIPTLSFTSGSEGRPKGVKGRHFSLTYYFPWMSETFDLKREAEEKFTMLSGIAHDPIQRDIFTPLFLGALLLIPAKEDIQYTKLAEWMEKYGATVTHLTPAMGQVLVGGATAQFPALKNAFFVGDILMKRDCRRLQELAPNVNIINMYGTTETQRSVSFYRIPSVQSNPTYLEKLGDVVPAGKGMKDVQLLVVDRQDKSKICGIGEPGEIYVRAGGLAEEYLEQEDLSKAKFLINWFCDADNWTKQDQIRIKSQRYTEPWRQFFRGPRDRLYRSGDIGRYRSDGNVECIGRVDNQIKIRGFRIELGDIDTHLSQHDLVQENVTLVRRDKDEEPTLVSYIVPNLQKWRKWLRSTGLKDDVSGEHLEGLLKRFRPLCEDVKAHLKQKLPHYAVPTVFVPLSRMPLNPNGKIDKPALPFPEPQEFLSAASQINSTGSNDRSETEETVARIWAQHIPRISARSIGPTDNFNDVGGDSILAQKVIFRVRQVFGDLEIYTRDLTSLRNFSARVDEARDPLGYRLDSGDLRRNTLQQETDYLSDARFLMEKLPETFQHTEGASEKLCKVLLTGSTGFLGAYILSDLLSRKNPTVYVVLHVRAKTCADALLRVKNTCKAFQQWKDSWEDRIECVTGDLEKPNIGIKFPVWQRLSQEVDAIIHNGARVNWVLPYTALKAANVNSTISLIRLCSQGKAKRLGFVSSTSVLDTEHYFNLSDKLFKAGYLGINECDNLDGSRKGLATGYGQSKWVSEYLTREAGRRGLKGSIIRPGYITGDSLSGITITDDFLVRLLKGCVQLQSRPMIDNTVNMVPVNHVARVVVAATFQPTASPLYVAHVTSKKRLNFDDFLKALETYGYFTPRVDYDMWRHAAKSYVRDPQKLTDEFALLPLLDMVSHDLPNSTKAPELDDSNAVAALKADLAWTGEDRSSGSSVTSELVGLYLSYLVAIGFMPRPEHGKGKPLPTLQLSEDSQRAMKSAGGRGAR